MYEVGDAIELTMDTATGAAVTAVVTAPGSTSHAAVTVPESPAESGMYPLPVLLTAPGMWQIRFTAAGTVTASETFHVFAEQGLPPLATAAQVAGKLRTLSDAEQGIVTAWLHTASRIIRSRVPDVDARINAGSLDASLAADVAVAMVLRVATRPGALSGVGHVRSETTGPFRRDYYDTAASGDTTSGIAVTDAEIALLVEPSNAARRPGGTIRTQLGLAPAAPRRRPGGGRVRFW